MISRPDVDWLTDSGNVNLACLFKALRRGQHPGAYLCNLTQPASVDQLLAVSAAAAAIPPVVIPPVA